MATSPCKREQIFPVHLLTREKQADRHGEWKCVTATGGIKNQSRCGRQALSFKTSVTVTVAVIVSHLIK